MLKIWFVETRPQFLLLSVVLAFLGASIAGYDGSFRPGYFLLAAIGLLLAHTSVNVLNDYFDNKSGIDLETIKTPFSGGSGVIQKALMTPRQVLTFGIVSFAVIVPIGIYFITVWGRPLLPLLIVAAVCILLYTPLILRLPWPEWSPGVGLGFLPVLGIYFVQTGNYNLSTLVAAVPSGILVHNLLLLNEFPDVDADRKAGRKTLPITIGVTKAAVVYSVLTITVYLWIAGGVVAGYIPVFSLIALGTLPIAIKAISGALKARNTDELMPAMKNNVLVVLLTQLLMGVGYIIA